MIEAEKIAKGTTPAPAVKPHCSTCGKDVAEVLCETCGKWWADNPPPAPAVSRDEAIEQIVVGFSDKAILHLDIDEDDPRLSLICDEMRQTVRAILSRIRGEGE